MEITAEIKKQIQDHEYMKHSATDFMRLWEVKEVSKIYEIVLLNVAAKEGVDWNRIYKESQFFPCLCVAVLLIYDALKYMGFNEKQKISILQDREYAIVFSYPLV